MVDATPLTPPGETDPLRFLVLSCSLDPVSRSRVLAELATERLRERGHAVELVDLRDHPLPAFDNAAVFDHPEVERLNGRIAAADGVLLASPVYNWSLGSALKNLVEVTGTTNDQRRAPWFDKAVTFLCAGGLPHSYMAHLSVANALMLDFKCLINPYHVYATERSFPPGGPPDEAMLRRLDRTLTVAVVLSGRFKDPGYSSDWEV